MKQFCLKIVITYAIIIFCSSSWSQVTRSDDLRSFQHPRILNSNTSKDSFIISLENIGWKKEYIERKKHEIEKYLELCENDPEWLVSRLQMNWKTKHSNVYLKGGNFSHSDGEAPVPTVRFSGTRDWATDYQKLRLEEVSPYYDDERGYYLKHKETGKKEWVHPSKVGHMIEGINRSILSIAQDAAFLYWLTGERKYAELATPIFFTYMEGMYYRKPPQVLDNSNQRFISGLATFEVIHEKAVIYLALIYDYLFNYFEQENKSLDHAQAVFQKWGDQIIKYGIPDNNWNLFQARFLMYIALVLEEDAYYKNGKGRQYYLRYTLEESTPRQIAIKDALLVYDQETGIWPESPSYSMHVITSLLEILAMLDNVTNSNELNNYPIIEKAALACFQYLFPSGNNVGFGDSGHGTIPFENFELLISNYHKYGEKSKEQMMTSLLLPYIKNGIYKRKVEDLFQLNFYVDEFADISPDEAPEMFSLMTPTFYAPNVSMFVQRMGIGDNATMVSTVGSFGNHAHTNGVSIELFANNYVHAPDMGRGKSYWSADFKEYYAKMPAHNTVVVDGKSDYSNMRSFHPYSLDHHYPKSGQLHPSFNQVSFSQVSFVEPKTNAHQQRLTAIINTPIGKPYVLDLFRSKTENKKQKHEYFYHNLGHAFNLYTSKGKLLTLQKTNDLSSKGGQLKAYDYLMDKKRKVIDDDLRAVFTINEEDKADNLMKLWIKGAENQCVFSATSPKSNAITKGVGTAPTSLREQRVPTLILRRNKEAWTHPFVVVFNPYFKNGSNPIQDVLFSQETKYDQQIKVLHSDGLNSDKVVITTSENDVIRTDQFYQKGWFSVVRALKGQDIPEFIFASGIYQVKYKEWEIMTVSTPATVSIEKTKEGLMLSNDQAIVVRVPKSPGFVPEIIRLYQDDGSYIERKGNENRSNTNQIEFRIEKPYRKILMLY